MSDLIITNIRKSYFDSEFDLVTAIILSNDDHDPRCLDLSKKSCDSLLVLESATAEEEYPLIGVQKGDQFIRMLMEHDHGLNVGEGIKFMERS